MSTSVQRTNFTPFSAERAAEIAFVAILVTVAMYFLGTHYAEEKVSLEQNLARQVGELSYRISALEGDIPVELLDKDGSAVAAAARALKLDRVSNVGWAAIVRRTGSQLDSSPKPPAAGKNEPEALVLEGFLLKNNILRDEWGGELRLYTSESLKLISYSYVPEEVCKNLVLKTAHTPYLFLCNGRLMGVTVA